MKKVIRDGKIAVLYSPGFGAGWFTWNDSEQLIFDPDIVARVEAKKPITDEFMASLGYIGYWGGSTDLCIAWVPVGTMFKIHEYDGAESVRYFDKSSYFTA